MLDARVPAGGRKEEERKGGEEKERKISALLEETRLWRTANSAQWVAWGIVQAKIPGLSDITDVGGEEKVGGGEVEGKNGAGEGGEKMVHGEGVGEEKVLDGEGEEKEVEEQAEEEFDYLAYAQDRAYFFLGDCVLLGLVKVEELGPEVREWLKIVEY